LLFSPPESLLVCTERGAALRALAPAIVSRKAGPRFVGYMRAQKQRLIGTRGQRRVNRPELIEAHGFDTKYAMHAARLGFQGLELVGTGQLELPIQGEPAEWLRAVRRGEVPFADWWDRCLDLDARLAATLTDERRPEGPQRERIEAWLVRTHLERWARHG
jgi:hypothetical protein